MISDPKFTNIVSAALGVHEKVGNEIIKRCSKESKIVDLGAGEGKVLNYLSKNNFTNLLAVDLENNFKLSNTEFRLIDLDKDFPLQSEEFDAVVSSEVIEHVENPWHFVREIARILKKGGIAVITTPNTNNLLSRLGFLRKGTFRMFEDTHYTEWGHISPLTWHYLTKYFEKNGLEILSHQYNTDDKFVGSKKQILFQKIFFFFFKKLIKGELGGDVNIITVRKI